MTTPRIRSVLMIIAAVAVGVGVAGAVQATANPADGTLQQLDGDGTEANPYVITNAEELQAMNEDLGAHYVLGEDIDASGTAAWNGGDGFVPVGGTDGEFNGTLDGQGHVVVALTIDRPGRRNTGLFAVQNGTVRDLELRAASVRGGSYTGAIAGRSRHDITDVVVDAEVRGENYVGAIAGDIRGKLVDSVSHGTVVGDRNVGGAAGRLSDSVRRVGSTADVRGDGNVGGLLGRVGSTTVRETFATGAVDGTHETGGLVGFLSSRDGRIVDSRAVADVTVEDFDGGGLVGREEGGTIRTSYAASTLSGEGSLAGLFGQGDGTDGRDVYWDTEVSGLTNAISNRGGPGSASVRTEGLTTEEMTGSSAADAMAGLDFEDTWVTTEEYPALAWEVRALQPVPADDVLVVGEETEIAVHRSLVGGRTVAAASDAEVQSDEPAVASVEDGSLVANSPGSATLSVDAAGDTGTSTVVVISDHGVSAIDAELGASEVETGETVTVTGTFRNMDETATEHEATLTVESEAVSTETIELAGGADEEFEFAWTPADSGEYELHVDSLRAGSLTVVGADGAPAGQGSGPGDSGGQPEESGSAGSTEGDSANGGGGLSISWIVAGVLGLVALRFYVGWRL